MPYTLCETIENGDKCFVAVPSKWENNNILLYPPKTEKKLMKYKQDEHSQPEVTWERYICTVKVNNISNYREAIDLEKLYGDRLTDTEAEERYGEMNKRKRRCVMKSQHSIKKRYDAHDGFFKEPKVVVIENIPSLANEFVGDTKSLTNNLKDSHDNLESNNSVQKPMLAESGQTAEMYISANESLASEGQSIMYINADDGSSYETNCNNSLQVVELENNNSNDAAELQLLKAKIDSINVKLDIQGEEMAKIQVMLQEIYGVVVSNSSSRASTSLENLFNLETINCPFSTVDQVDNFEAKLGDNTFRSQIMKRLTAIGGINGDNDAFKVANSISETLFKQELLREFTWTGKAAKGTTKVAFLKYSRIIQIYFDVVRLANHKYTHMDNKNFFIYTMLKYSGIRASHQNRKKEKNALKTSKTFLHNDSGVEEPMNQIDETDMNTQKNSNIAIPSQIYNTSDQDNDECEENSNQIDDCIATPVYRCNADLSG